MIFNASMGVDPSQLTKIQRVVPTGGFRKFCHNLTFGLSSRKEEIETFTAVAILEQLKLGLQRIQVNNIIRLSHDDIDFYLDREGKEDDFDEAFENYDMRIDQSMAKFFKQLFLVLEHSHGSFNYIIEVTINRTHDVGTFPIEVKVDGFIKEFKAANGATSAQMRKRMEAIFQTQESYNQFVEGKRVEFESFVKELKSTLAMFIRVDEIAVSFSQKMIVPEEEDVPSAAGSSYQHYDQYYGFSDALFYAMLWSGMSRSHNIHIHNTYVVNHDGYEMGYLDGVEAGDIALFDYGLTTQERMEAFHEQNMEHEQQDFDDHDFDGNDYDYSDGGDNDYSQYQDQEEQGSFLEDDSSDNEGSFFDFGSNDDASDDSGSFFDFFSDSSDSDGDSGGGLFDFFDSGSSDDGGSFFDFGGDDSDSDGGGFFD